MKADGHPGLVALGLGPRAGMHLASHLSLRRVFLHAVYRLVCLSSSWCPRQHAHCGPTELLLESLWPPLSQGGLHSAHPWKGPGPWRRQLHTQSSHGKCHPSIRSCGFTDATVSKKHIPARWSSGWGWSSHGVWLPGVGGWGALCEGRSPVLREPDPDAQWGVLSQDEDLVPLPSSRDERVPRRPGLGKASRHAARAKMGEGRNLKD